METTYRELLLNLCDNSEDWIGLYKHESVRVKLDMWHAFNGYPGKIDYTAAIRIDGVVVHKVSKLYDKDAKMKDCEEDVCETLFHQILVYGLLTAYEVSKKIESK